MKLRSKVFIILLSMWAIISLLIYIDSNLTLKRDYKKIEKHQVVTDIDRTRKAFKSMLNSLRILDLDWANWDDAYNFMGDKNQKFIQDNVVPTTYANAKLNFIFFFDTQGKLFYGQAYHLKQAKFVPIPPDLINFLETHPSFTVNQNTSTGHIGILKINEGYVVMSSQPILTSKGHGPVRGTLMMGFYLDADHINKLAETVEMSMDFYPLPLTNVDPTVSEAYKQLVDHHYQNFIMPKNQNYIYGFTLMHDISGQPIGLLRILIPRTLYSEGLMTIEHYLIIVGVIGILVLIAMWYFLKRFVLDRMISVSNQVINIKNKSQFTDRIKIGGDDELSNMVLAINSLMEIIELTQEQLKERLLKSTKKLERLSGLNKNLFEEINRQKELELKYRAEEKILKQLARHDELTGLPNRFYFNELLEEAIDTAARTNTQIAVLFLDIDKFKSINDTFGHNVGDLYLKHVAQLLKNVIKDDVIARLSGDEFVIFLKKINNKDDINKIIEKLFHELSTPLHIENRDILSTFSIGVSLFPDDAKSAEELKKLSDLAMYFAKQHRGNTYFYFDNVVEKPDS